MPLSIEERTAKKEEFLTELKSLYNKMTFQGREEDEIDMQFTKVISILSHFEIEMLPYSTASKFIYEINDDDVEYFFVFFEQKLAERMTAAPKEEVFLKALKLLEHLELASSQKAYLFQQQEVQLKELSSKVEDVNRSIKQYEDSKTEIEQSLKDFEKVSMDFENFNMQFESFKSDFSNTEKKFERIEKNTEQITVNLISILGIFASILLGAYGSIQGFSNIFKSADKISTGKILILSSIGASAVLLILFFLLSSVARLTSRKFGNGGHNFIEKHPIMFYSHCILFIIFTTGGVIELIKYEVVLEKFWIWGVLLVFAIIQVTFIHHTKSLLGILKYYKESSNAFKQTLRYIIFLIMALLIAAYYYGYL
jgi:hypothetical protein